MNNIQYRFEQPPDFNQVIQLYNQSFTENPRPTESLESIKNIFKHSNLICCAYHDQHKLIGVARAFSDFSYVTYVSDLAVSSSFQDMGVGKTLLEYLQSKSGANCKLVLLSNTHANTYYPHIGFTPHARAWVREPS